MQPTLQAISPEQSQNIPGADITFPAVGEYRIVLTVLGWARNMGLRIPL